VGKIDTIRGTMDAAVNTSMARANAALKNRNGAEAAGALREALALMSAPPSEVTALRAMPALQATFMSFVAGDLALAQQFAALVLSNLAEELEELCGNYQLDLDQNKSTGPALCFQAANYAVAFLPFISHHPWVSWDDLLLAGDSGMNTSVVAMLKNMRPQLDKLGWAAWAYPPKAEEAARHWSARALMDWGRLLMDNVRSGTDVQSAQALAETSLNLIQREPEDQITADALNLLGHVFYSYGDFDITLKKAVPSFTESIRILEAIGNTDDAAIDRGNLGALLIGQAEFAAANGDEATADQLYGQAEINLKPAVEAHRTCKYRDHLPGALINLGSLYLSREDWPRAESTYTEALGAANAVPAPFLAITALANLGSAQVKQGKTKAADAERNLRGAVVLIEGPPGCSVDPETFALAYGELGDALRIQGKSADAETYLAQAIERLETYSFSFFSERSKGVLFKTFRWVYEALIDCCATLAIDRPDRAATAFNLAERIKWRSLTEILRYAPLHFPGMESEPLLEEETSLLNQIFNLAIDSPGRTQPDLDTDSILRRLEEIWTKLEPHYPEFVAMRRQKTVEAREAASWLDDKVPTLVEYYLGDDLDTALAFVLKKGATWPEVIRLPSSPSDIAGQIVALRPKEGEEFQPPEAFKAVSEQLHRSLIAPLLQFLPEGSGVCFVPCGALHNLPFAALFDGRQYLIERNPVVVAPSATGLRWWRAHESPHAPQSCLIAAFSTRSGVGQDLNEFKKLAREQIAGLFSQSTVISSEQATKARLQAELSGTGGQQWDVVHIACHGNFEPDGLQSYLEVQPAPDATETNWTALEIFTQVRTASTLVTLSACDSGIAETSTNDEIAGLAQAFLFGGASCVLASLWRLQQGIGVEITHDFYDLWMGRSSDHLAHSKIEALQIALQARLRERSWLGLKRKAVSPYLWSAFQLYGDWR
jgi:CHAT domain-containing protein/tetratricopeptide (TPR) repeat protein